MAVHYSGLALQHHGTLTAIYPSALLARHSQQLGYCAVLPLNSRILEDMPAIDTGDRYTLNLYIW